MAKRSSQTFQKYQKEQVRRQKQTHKAARRFPAKQRQAQAATGMSAPPVEMADGRPGSQPAPAPGDRVSEPTSARPRETSR